VFLFNKNATSDYNAKLAIKIKIKKKMATMIGENR